MGKILSVVNQKGGVGKTTSCINLIAALGKLGKQCLLVDIDAQGNSTSGLESIRGKWSFPPTIYWSVTFVAVRQLFTHNLNM